MFSLILSAFLGVFATKLMDRTGKKSRKNPTIYIVSGIALIFLIIIYTLIGKMETPPEIYNIIEKAFVGFESNVLLQSIMIVVTVAGIVILDVRSKGVLSFEQYSEKIKNFTELAHEGSDISIIAGDMDFFGRVKIKIDNIGNFQPVGEGNNEKKVQLMENSEEYKQLIKLRNAIKLRILCNHGLETELFNAIMDGTISPRALYTRYRQNDNLNDKSFQQLLRIGKIKTDFGDSVEVRFYNSNLEDKQLRARFVDNEGIVYQKERNRNRFKLEKIEKFPFYTLRRNREVLYSINYLNNQEFVYYSDMFSLKWDACDSEKSKKIVSFCELLYHYINDDEIRYHMALVYVNSYEVARKGEKRKEFPPFGVLYLAACVDRLPGWKVDLIAVDEHTRMKDLETWSKYDVIGASIISSYSYGILKRCFNASKKRKDVVILAGGYQAFKDFNANIIFKGEGEDSIQSFCQHYPNGNYSDIEGIIYRRDIDNKICSTKGRGCVDIDKIPTPARYLLPTSDVVMTDRLAGTDLTMVHMLFSRGCPYDCYYCAANQTGYNKHIRYRDKMKIVQELEELKETYKIQGFSIIDDCFLTVQDKAIEICEYIADSQVNLSWSLAARVDNINDEVLIALKKAGCIEIKFGVETGSNELLRQMHKGDTVTVECAENAIRRTKDFGIKVKLFIITGLPGENENTHTETKKFLEKMYQEKLVDRVSLLRYTPLAGSHIYDHPNRFGVNKKMLNIATFEKTRLYKESFDWWVDRNRYKKCNKWYEDMQKFIETRWGDK